MKKWRKIFPVILMAWPYLFALLAVIPDDGAIVYRYMIAYVILTIIVYSFNIWIAFTEPCEDFGHRLAFYDMLIKLIHIPFYIAGFVIGLILAFAMVVPALIFVSPFLIAFIFVIEMILMLTSSMYGINAAVRLLRKKAISKKTAVLHIILHLIFVTDVISAICLYRKTKRLKELQYGR